MGRDAKNKTAPDHPDYKDRPRISVAFISLLCKAERAAAVTLVPQLRTAVAKFFFAIDHTNIATRLGGIAYDYN